MLYLWGCWPMKSGVNKLLIVLLMAGASSCAAAQSDMGGASDTGVEAVGPQADYPIVVGEPYDVGGVRHTPVDVLNYDQVGYAGTIPDSMAGEVTARGERFVPSSVAGAHKTLPLPAYVEVTSLETGKTILVRLIERGPMDNSRLIDLSSGARAQLGHGGADRVAVRVRRVNPPEVERALLRGGGQAPARMDTPQSLLAVLKRKLDGQPAVAAASVPPARVTTPPARPARPAATPAAAPAPAPASRPPVAAAQRPSPPVSVPDTPPAPVETQRSGRFIVEQAGRPTRTVPAPPPAGVEAQRAAPPVAVAAPVRTAPAAPVQTVSSNDGYVVQVAAFSSRARADALARQLEASVTGAGNVWRVRYGPYSTMAQADAQLARVRARGYRAARVLSAR